MNIRNLIAAWKIIILTCLFTISALPQNQDDEAAIRKIVQDEITAWNKEDAVAYGRNFAESGTFTNLLGNYSMGHDAFVKEHEQIFKTIFRNSTLQQDIVSLQFPVPDVAVVEVLTAVTGMHKVPGRGDSFDTKGRLRTRLLQVITKREGKWEIVAYHNVEVKDAVNAPEPK